MKRTLQTLLFALIAIMMPIVAWAQETTVQAKWGASAEALTGEGTLAAAFSAAAADGSTVGYIQLQADVASTLDNPLAITGGEFILDLKGHTLSSDDYSVLEIYYSGTHVTITGEAEGSKVTCSSSGYPTVLLSEDASLTIASGTFTSTGYVVFQTDGNLVIEGGTFTASNNSTINYVAGTVDLSHYSDVTGISIGNYSGASVASSTITLPSGYCFYDSNNLPVTELQSGETYTIGVVEAKWGASADALTGGGTLAEAFSAAAADGSTVGYIQLQTDVAATQEIDGGEFTLDLNGHTLSSDDYNVLIIYSGTHVTLTGEGNMTCTASGYSTVALSEEASLTIASGIFTSTGYVVFQTSGNLVINGGTFTASNNSTINYVAGTVDLSHYSDVTGISIRKNSGASVASSTITLPSGYCFYDNNSSAVTVLQANSIYTIGEEPEQKYTVTFDAGGGEGTMEDGISYGGDYMLPECAFTAPEGKMFKAWQVGESEQQPGAIVSITDNTTVTALWCDYVPQITIKMNDSFGDGWSGNTIIVKKNGEQIGTATIEDGSYSNTVRYDYDNSAEYTFYWQLGEADDTYPEECSFKILVEDEVVFTVATGGCENYTDGQLIHTIAVAPIEVETLTIADGELEVYSNNAALTIVGTLTYTRTLPNLEWNALYVPFEIPVSQLTDSYDVAYINDAHSYDNDEDGTIDELKMEVIHITAGTLNANYPYLIRAKNDEAMTMNLVITDAALYATKVNTVTCSSVFMKFDVTGTYAQMTADDLTDEEGNTSLVITTDGSWQQLAAESTLNPFRLYLTMTTIDGSPVKVAPEAARSMRIVTRGETTRIENSELKTETPADVYDLQGRRVENPTKGIYIVNGKKVVLK